MDNKLKEKLAQRTYEVGYGKPPTQGQFVKGRSGNPKGRPKKKEEPKRSAKPLTVDATSRDLVLQVAARMIGARGDGDVKVTAEEAVLHSQLSAAVKGNSNAQKSFLDRVERCRAELNAEIAEDHKFWREYCDTYPKAVASMQKAGKAIPVDWPHPEDLVFQEGKHVMLRGGDAHEGMAACEAVVRLRDVYMLQSIKDERSFEGPLKSHPIFLSGVLAMCANISLPKRMQLDDTQYLLQILRLRGLRPAELRRRLKETWIALGCPKFADVTTPLLREDAIERLRRC